MSPTPNATRKKRQRSPMAKDEPVDLEGPPSPEKLMRTLSGFEYSAPSTSGTRLTRSKRAKIEVKGDEMAIATTSKVEGSEASAALPVMQKGEYLDTSKAPSPSPMKRKQKQKAIQMELDVPHAAPENWEEVHKLIQEMRKGVEAPVDTMGCAAVMLDELDPKKRRYGTLVSLMLSSQTKDEVTAAAIARLKTALGTLTIDTVLAAPDSVLQEAVCKVGFWRRKTGYIKQAAQKLKDEFDSDVPKTVDELCSLPGVGPKMAFLVLQVAWNLNLGIGVDVHVHRITNRLGWHKPPTSTPEQTRLNLQSWLPKELHGPINPLLVGFGQMTCLPVGPKCDKCLLSERGLCPSARTVKPKTARTPSKAKAMAALSINDDSLVKMEGEVEDGSPRVKVEVEV